ncbi:hypothetical protein OsJ_36439 [Oryza sativa Japonica Group]|uniref:Uncharacterized protein n=2 Tax=Oryza sativa subsp. japonica TaxID=39947 RepID=B9GDN5_ORYSJ|nr:uncharacterized protein LOC107276127 [Oryza sativa Japonica Group]EEE53392.1 hypothetical protein OsJ_36439 [Oryza sativa Japonica Group]KAF2908256.1 hypothetical protein DAI22_12g171700 [Oryza sativa Japonica Group]
MARPREPIDTSKWAEVKSINNYALFMGYMSMAVKGLGYLVVLWTTVILLGGFVSVLGKKDFWCLTIITLVQTAGVSDVLLNEKLQYIRRSFSGFFTATLHTLLRKSKDVGVAVSLCMPILLCDYILNELVLVFVWVVHVLVFGIILCPLAAFYIFGLLITTGLSVWRLIQRDYGEADGGANLRPALNVVYSIAVLQGVLFCYRFASRSVGRELVVDVLTKYNFDSFGSSRALVEYLHETRTGCEKDPSFVEGRNLVTYAVELTRSESPNDFLSGARILATLLDQPELSEQHRMIKLLVISASSSQVLDKLLQTMDCNARPKNAEARELAARIVAHLAGNLHLEQFPGGIQFIASLLDGPVEEEEEDDDDNIYYRVLLDYNKELMRQGLLILGKLAADANCRQAIVDTEGLLTKIMEPLRSGLLHLNGHNDTWSDTVYASMEVMRRLVTAPGKTGEEVRRRISGDMEAMASMERILKCKECSDLLLQSLEIYTRLHERTLSNKESWRSLINILVHTFTQFYVKDDIRGLAGEKLAALSSHGHGKENAKIILQVKEEVIDDLTKMLANPNERNKFKIRAAQILEQLCIHLTDDDEYLQCLKKALKIAMPTVLSIALGEGYPSSNLLATVLSLCATMLRNFTNAEDFARLFDDEITSAGFSFPWRGITSAGFSFPRRLKHIVIRNSYPSISCLKTLKLITEIFMLMVRHGSGYTKEETDSLMESLSEAAVEMSDLENFMLISRNNRDGTKTLDFIVKEAKEELMQRERELQKRERSNSVNGNPIYY